MKTLSKIHQQTLALVLSGATLFNLFFWQEKLGVNLVMFNIFLLVAQFVLYPGALKKRTVRWLLLAQCFCLVMIVVNDSALSKIIFFIVSFLMVAFIQYEHRSPWFAMGSFVLNVILFTAGFYEQVKNSFDRYFSKRYFNTIGRVLSILLIPSILVVIFFCIYQSANAVVSNLTDGFFRQIGWFMGIVGHWVAIDRLLFLGWGIYFVGSLLTRSRVDFFEVTDSAFSDELNRVKLRSSHRQRNLFQSFFRTIIPGYGSGMVALKSEYRTGLLSLFLLNLLLLVINCIDIIYVWFGFTYRADAGLSQMVHEGTGLLILSIVMAMAVLLFIFKGNLNFYKQNKWLRAGAYIWIIQNAILVFSVLLRDYYYIFHLGLAYKRIAVLFFLVAVATGLVTVFIKICYKKTNYFLFRVNVWAAVVMLVIASAINWDAGIARYNIAHRDRSPIDWQFLISLSDKALPVLEANKNLIPTQPAGSCVDCFANRLEERKLDFLLKQQRYSWLSWNYSDQYIKSTINRGTPHISSIK